MKRAARDDRHSGISRSAAPGRRAESREARPVDPEKLVARQNWALLRPMLLGGADEVAATLDKLKKYAGLLLGWNRGVSNLISRHDEARLVERHFAESLFPAALLRDSGCERFVDLGAGAGLPGIPLALAGVGAHWTLVESRRNKTLFMRKVLQECALSNVSVLTSRMETAIVEALGDLACDGFTSRATMAVGPTLQLAARIVRPGGRAFLWKGSGFGGEMESARRAWEEDWRFESAVTSASGPNLIALFSKK